MAANSRVVMIPLLNKYRMVTAGGAFVGSKILVELTAPAFTAILPFAEELVLYTVGESMTVNMNWGIFFTSGFDRTFELPAGPFAIGNTVTQALAGPTRHAAYTTITNFQLASRLFVGFGNGAGGGFESGIGSAVLAVKTWGM